MGDLELCRIETEREVEKERELYLLKIFLLGLAKSYMYVVAAF